MRKPEKPPFKGMSYTDPTKMVELMLDNHVMEKLADIEKEYPYWESFKYKTKKLVEEPRFLWEIVQFRRSGTSMHLRIDKQPGFHFKYNTPGRFLQMLHEFDLHLGGVLEGSSIIPEEQKNRLLISSIMEEAIASSQLEGAVTTRGVAKAMLQSQRKPKNHSEKMILNNYLSIREILKMKDRPFTVDLIKHIHKTISKNTLKDPANEGQFRTSDDVKVVDMTGEVFYEPPSHIHLDSLMESFCVFANSEKDTGFIHPIIRGIILHFLIGYIHPFVDGNGRTARAIFYWYLLSKGYWLVEYLSISRIIIKSPTQYARAYLYTEYDDNDLTYFIDYNLKSIDLALNSLKGHIKKKVEEKRDLYNLLKHAHINERQAEVIKEFINDGMTILSISEMKTRYAIAYQTARTDLQKLETAGYLKSKPVGKKRVYFKSDNFDALLGDLR